MTYKIKSEKLKEKYFKEISPYIMDMRIQLNSKGKNDKIISKKIGNRKYILLETPNERNLFVLEGNYYSKLLMSSKIK